MADGNGAIKDRIVAMGRNPASQFQANLSRRAHGVIVKGSG